VTKLPVKPALRQPEKPEDMRWLVENLWAEQPVGIIGGEPESSKSCRATAKRTMANNRRRQ